MRAYCLRRWDRQAARWSEDSDTKLLRLVAGLARLRWYFGNPLDTVGDMAAADAIDDALDEKEARRAGRRVPRGRQARQRPSAWEMWTIRALGSVDAQ